MYCVRCILSTHQDNRSYHNRLCNSTCRCFFYGPDRRIYLQWDRRRKECTGGIQQTSHGWTGQTKAESPSLRYALGPYSVALSHPFKNNYVFHFLVFPGGQFAAWGLCFATFDCSFAKLRQKEDPWNSIMSGGAAGAVMAAR